MTVSYGDPERPNLYNYIRYASKLIKVRSELHKQQSIGAGYHIGDIDTSPIISKQNDLGLKALCRQEALKEKEKEEEEEEEIEKRRRITTAGFTKNNNVNINTSRYFSLQATRIKQDLDDLERNISYLSTLKKLNGLETNNSQSNKTAILISLSPNVLSAANVARQRRKCTR